MLNHLNILHWKCTGADKFFVSIFIKMVFFAKEDKILIKNLWKLKGYTASRFHTEFRTKKHKFWLIRNELLYKLIILLNKSYFGLLYANLVVWKFTEDL